MDSKKIGCLLTLATFILISVVGYATSPQSRAIIAGMVGNDEKAITLRTKQIEKNPNDASGYFWRGGLYYQTEQYHLAIDDFTMAIQLEDKGIDEEYDFRAASYMALGEYELAILDYTEAINLRPYWYYFSGRGSAYHEKGDFYQAQADFNRAIEINPQRPYPYSDRADTYISIGETSLAIADLHKAIELSDPKVDQELIQSVRERLAQLGVSE